MTASSMYVQHSVYLCNESASTALVHIRRCLFAILTYIVYAYDINPFVFLSESLSQCSSLYHNIVVV